MSVFDIIRRSGASFSWLLVLFILPFICTSGIIVLIINNEEAIHNLSSVQWILFYGLASLCMAFAITHTTFIALVSGYFLGFFSLPYIIMSYVSASLLGYYAAKLLDRGKFLATIASLKGVDRVITNLKKDEAKVIFLARLSPVLPFSITNALLSFLKADLAKFLTAGFLGMLPRTILFIWIGSKAAYIREALEQPQENFLEKVLFTALLLVSITGVYYYFNKAFKK